MNRILRFVGKGPKNNRRCTGHRCCFRPALEELEERRLLSTVSCGALLLADHGLFPGQDTSACVALWNRPIDILGSVANNERANMTGRAESNASLVEKHFEQNDNCPLEGLTCAYFASVGLTGDLRRGSHA
jgi:hypothetical protein